MRPDPKVDYAFKKVFGSEPTVDVLENMVNAALERPADSPLVGFQINNPFNEKETAEDKLSILDIKARDVSGRLYNVEMQMLALHHFKERSLFYWARVYSSQLVAGLDYRELRPTISICFVDTRLWPKISRYKHRFIAMDPQTQEVLSDHLEMHFIELPKFTLMAEQVKTPLEVWCYFLNHAETLDSSNLPAALNIPPIHHALEVLNVMGQNDAERERYEARLKALRDVTSSLAGERQEGRMEGKLMGQVRFCQLLLKQPQTPEEELEKLSVEELSRLADEWQQKVIPPAS